MEASKPLDSPAIGWFSDGEAPKEGVDIGESDERMRRGAEDKRTMLFLRLLKPEDALEPWNRLKACTGI